MADRVTMLMREVADLRQALKEAEERHGGLHESVRQLEDRVAALESSKAPSSSRKSDNL